MAAMKGDWSFVSVRTLRNHILKIRDGGKARENIMEKLNLASFLPSRPVYPECQVEFHSELGGKRGSTDSSGEVLRTGSQLCWQRTITHTTQAADILP